MEAGTGSDQFWTCIIAIDFGTTYSGYAYATKTSGKQDIKLRDVHNSEWQVPYHSSRSTWKAPTSILLTEDKKLHSFGYEAVKNYEKDPDRPWHYFSKFKMLLYDTRRIDGTTTITSKNGKAMNACYIFSLAINYIKDRAIKQIFTSRHISSENSDDIIKETLFVLTVPAIWSDKAKCFMRKAAELAGIPSTNLKLVLEPEAASMYCRHAHLTKSGSQFEEFKPGTTYILVDIGGGTIDIATHRVQDDRRVLELYNAVGNDAGGYKFNVRFRRFLKDAFGRKWKEWKQTDRLKYLKMMKEIEDAKYCASANEKNILLSLSKSLEQTVKSGTKAVLQMYKNASTMWTNFFKHVTDIFVSQDSDELSISNEKVKTFFNDTIAGVVSEIEPIIKAFPDTFDAIILVGGVSSSAYIRQKVQERFSTLPVIVPDHPQRTVVSGAVLLGQQPQFIAGRIAQFTYGIEILRDFVEGEHREDYKYTRDGNFYCRNTFEKMIEKGQLLKYGDRFSTKSCIDANQADTKGMTFGSKLYQSTETSPMYVTDDGCTYLGEIRKTPPEGGWPDHTESTIELVVGEAEFKFHVKDTTNNREYETTVDFLVPNKVAEDKKSVSK